MPCLDLAGRPMLRSSRSGADTRLRSGSIAQRAASARSSPAAASDRPAARPRTARRRPSAPCSRCCCRSRGSRRSRRGRAAARAGPPPARRPLEVVEALGSGAHAVAVDDNKGQIGHEPPRMARSPMKDVLRVRYSVGLAGAAASAERGLDDAQTSRSRRRRARPPERCLRGHAARSCGRSGRLSPRAGHTRNGRAGEARVETAAPRRRQQRQRLEPPLRSLLSWTTGGSGYLTAAAAISRESVWGDGMPQSTKRVGERELAPNAGEDPS
jgi:hypothetical protein